MKRLFVMLLLVLFAGASFVGCGDPNVKEKGTEQKEEDPAEDACEHLGQTEESVTAGADAGNAVELAKGHQNYKLTLTTDEAGKKVGYVKFTTKEGGEFNMFATKNVNFQFVDSTGVVDSAVSATAGTTTNKCSKVGSYVKVANLPAKAYIVKLTVNPADAEFNLVYLPAGAEEEGH